MKSLKTKLKQKTFLVALFSALLLASQSIVGVFDYTLTAELGIKITIAFNSVLTVLVLLGIVKDHGNDTDK